MTHHALLGEKEEFELDGDDSPYLNTGFLCGG